MKHSPNRSKSAYKGVSSETSPMKRPVAVAHQPDFLPYLGFFHRLIIADTFVVLDHVQFVKRGWHNRDQIKTANGPLWLSVPVQSKGKYTQAIHEVPIHEEGGKWRRKHLQTIENAYRKAPHFEEVFPLVETAYAANHETLCGHNGALIEGFLDLFSIEVQVQWSSQLSPEGSSNKMLIDLMRKVDCGTYLSGPGARDYMDEQMWRDSGIDLAWQEFEHPVYPQLHGEFVPYLSSIDFAMMCGPDLRGALGLD